MSKNWKPNQGFPSPGVKRDPVDFPAQACRVLPEVRDGGLWGQTPRRLWGQTPADFMGPARRLQPRSCRRLCKPPAVRRVA